MVKNRQDMSFSFFFPALSSRVVDQKRAVISNHWGSFPKAQALTSVLQQQQEGYINYDLMVAELRRIGLNKV